MIKILLICGSLRKKSFNSALMEAMISVASHDIKMIKAPSIASLPYFNPDSDDITNPSDSVREFRAAISQADGIFIFSPEYAHDIPGVLKNALDWVVASGELVDKKVGIINASTSFYGGNKAHARLHYLLKLLSVNLVEEACMMVSSANKKIDENGSVTDDTLVQELTKKLYLLKASILGQVISYSRP